jgi:hypothetical protein
VDEGIFGFSKTIVGDSCPGGPVCHVHVLHYSVNSNVILGSEGNGRAIGLV